MFLYVSITANYRCFFFLSDNNTFFCSFYCSRLEFFNTTQADRHSVCYLCQWVHTIRDSFLQKEAVILINRLLTAIYIQVNALLTIVFTPSSSGWCTKNICRHPIKFRLMYWCSVLNPLTFAITGYSGVDEKKLNNKYLNNSIIHLPIS